MGSDKNSPDKFSIANRRSLLKVMGASGVGALAGCLGDDDDDPADDTDDTDDADDADDADDDDGVDDEDHDPIGNWPPEDDVVVLGHNADQSGGLALEGAAGQRGFELAVDHLNNGGGIVDTWDVLSGDGILGYEVEGVTGDSQAEAEATIENVERFIDRDGVQAFFGGVSSTVTMAAQPIAQREKVPYLGALSTSAGISGDNCSRYYFHSSTHAELMGLVASEVLPEIWGEDREMFHIFADYSYGQSMRDATNKYFEPVGWENVGEAGIAVGEHDHGSQIAALDDSGADTLIFSSFGEFAVSGLSQLNDAGLMDDIEVYIPHLTGYTLEPAGDFREGVAGCASWNRHYDDEHSQAFVEAYEEEYDEPATQTAMIAYNAVLQYAAAAEEAGTMHPPTIVRTLEEFEWDAGLGPSQYRECDHQREGPGWVVQGVTEADEDPDGYVLDVLEVSDPVIYDCDEFPANECPMDDQEYGDE